MYMSPVEKRHTVSAFDDELAEIRATINVMAGLAGTALSSAMEALAARDPGKAADVVAGDAAIDALEDQLEKQVVRSLALRAPMADDLRYLVMAIRIGAMLERAGDHAKNIAKRSEEVEGRSADALLALLREMSGLAGSMIGQAVESFNRRDAAQAMTVRERDGEMNERHDEVTCLITREMEAEESFISAGIHLLFISKQLERIGDYATNIANSVHYMVTGAHFAEDGGLPHLPTSH